MSIGKHAYLSTCLERLSQGTAGEIAAMPPPRAFVRIRIFRIDGIFRISFRRGLGNPDNPDCGQGITGRRCAPWRILILTRGRGLMDSRLRGNGGMEGAGWEKG